MSKKSYRVSDGVEWVNGARVPSTRVVDLTEIEAKFDVDHGRIEPVRSTRTKVPVDLGDTDAN